MSRGKSAPGNDFVRHYGIADWRALRDLIEFGDRAARLVARGRAAYDEDEMLQYAAQKICIDVGEAAGRLSPKLIADQPEINFVGMRQLHNYVVDHAMVDAATVWNTIAVALPADRDRVRDLIASD